MCFCGVWFLLSNAFASRCWTIPRLLGPRNAQSRRKFVSCSFVVGLTVFHIVFSFKRTYVQSLWKYCNSKVNWEDIWVWDKKKKKKRMTQWIRISAWCVRLELVTFCSKPPIFPPNDQKILEHMTGRCFLLPRCVPSDWLFKQLNGFERLLLVWDLDFRP